MPHYRINQSLDCDFVVEADDENLALEDALSAPLIKWPCDIQINVDEITKEQFDDMMTVQEMQ